MDKIKIGLIGCGNIGNLHMNNFNWGTFKEAEISVVCDIDPEKLEAAKKKLNNKVPGFLDAEEMMKSGLCDTVLIAVPHYLHPVLAIKAFELGLNVISEKPAGVFTKKVREMNDAAEKSGKAFGMMFNQRTNPLYKKVKELINMGEIGEIVRVNWIITNWYRTQSYYDSGTWRATWGGEGGGVLLNQCPHQIDLLQWLCGMPSKVHSFCHYGKYHDIEVEDDVTAYFEYPNGATGVFVTCTGECPAANRLQIDGTKGQIIVENDQIQFKHLKTELTEHRNTCPGGFNQPEVWDVKVPVCGMGNNQHADVINNYAAHVLRGEPLLAPGTEGIKGLTISNAIHLSDWLGKTVELPIDEDLFYDLLQEKIKTSKFKKKEVKDGASADLGNSFTK